MKQKLLFLLTALCFGFVSGVKADVTVPTPVYFQDFESASTEVGNAGSNFGITGATLTGTTGAIITGDATFGKYYQNMSTAEAITTRANYLTLVNETAWNNLRTAVASSHAFAVSFWANAKVQRAKNFDSYWGAMFVGYTSSEGTTTPGVWDAATMKAHPFGPAVCSRGQFRYYNSADGTNYGDITDNNDAGRDDVGAWLNDDNWHHFAYVFAKLDQKTFTISCYVDGVKKYDLDETSYDTGMEMLNDIDRFVIGGSTPHWNDPDNAYAYDDIAIYSSALSADQVNQIIQDKIGTRYDYSITAVSGGTTIKEFISGSGVDGTEFSTYLPKVISYNGNCYELNDNEITNYFASYEIDGADANKEINYTLNSDIDYFFDAEEMTLSRQYGEITNNAAYSKGAGKGVYAGATLTSTSKVAAGVYTVSVTGVVRNSSKDVNFSISYSSKGGTWWSTGKNVTYKTNSSGATTGNVIEVIIPSESYIRLTEATGNNVNDYTDYVTLEKTRDLSAVEIAVIDCKRYDTSSAFATAIDAESFSTAAEVYAFNTSYHITNGVLTDGVRDITGVIRNAQVNDADATDWDGAGTYNAEQYEGAPDPYFIDNNGSQMWATQWIYGLPAGRYQVKVATRGAAANYNHIYINNGTADIAQVEGNHVGNTGGDLKNGWSWTYVPFTITETTNLIFGFYKDATNWAGCDDWHLYRVESVPASLGTNGYATFASPYALDLANLPEGLTAYKASVSENTVTFTGVTEAVQANTGLLLKGAASTTYSIPVAASGSDISATNAFLVNTNGIDVESGYTYYGLLKNTLTFATFDPASVTIPSDKAYLKVSDGTGARLAIAFEDDATGINAIKAAEAEAQKDGKYLEGGKIVIVKNGVKYSTNGQILK